MSITWMIFVYVLIRKPSGEYGNLKDIRFIAAISFAQGYIVEEKVSCSI